MSRPQSRTSEGEKMELYENFQKTTRISQMEVEIQENTTTMMNSTVDKLIELNGNVNAVTSDENLRSALLNAKPVTKTVGNLA